MVLKQVSVVVIGGSHAGIGVAQGALRRISNAKVTVINPSEYYYFNIVAPRIIAKPRSIPSDKYIYAIHDVFQHYPKTSFEFIKGTVTRISLEDRAISLQKATSSSSSMVPFDYLVIASGSTTSATIGKDGVKMPFKTNGAEDLLAAIKEAQSNIQQAQSIIVGGGGPIGVEFAGELAEAFKGVDITLVSATDLPLPGIKDTVRRIAEQTLKKKGVTVLASQRIESVRHDTSSKKWTVVLSTGDELTADAYVSATGVIPNNSFIPPSFLDRSGWVEVDEFLRVRSDSPGGRCSEPRIYALGDITTHQYRLLSRVPEQAKVVVANLEADIAGKQPQTTYSSDEQRKMMIVPIGESAGTGQFGSWVVPSFLVWYFKGKDFLTYKAPSFVSGRA